MAGGDSGVDAAPPGPSRTIVFDRRNVWHIAWTVVAVFLLVQLSLFVLNEASSVLPDGSEDEDTQEAGEADRELEPREVPQLAELADPEQLQHRDGDDGPDVRRRDVGEERGAEHEQQKASDRHDERGQLGARPGLVHRRSARR